MTKNTLSTNANLWGENTGKKMTDQIKNNKDIKEGEERMKEHDEKAKT